jgi:hypothetical protein
MIRVRSRKVEEMVLSLAITVGFILVGYAILLICEVVLGPEPAVWWMG